MRRFSGLQDEMLELFGLKQGEDRHFLKVEEISDFIEEAAAKEKSVGEPSFLWVPLRRDPPEVMQYRVKVVYDGFGWWIDYYERAYSLKEVDLSQQQPLSRLAEAAREVAKAAGCLKEEATAFLLANDIPFFVPLTAELDDGGGIEVHIRHPQVSVRDVARAIARVQGRAFAGSGLAPKPRHGWGTKVFEFVEMWREEFGKPDWEDCWEAFLEVQTEKPPYKKMRGFRQAYYDERRRRERVRREAEQLGE